MKKTLSTVILATMVLAALSAEDLFSFEFVADRPLFKESISDPYAFTASIHVMGVPKAEDNDFRVNCLVKDTGTGKLMYDNLVFRGQRKADDNLYINMKLPVSSSLFRTRFHGTGRLPSIDLDLNLLGYLNTVFCLYGANDTLGFDGSFQVSSTLRIADSFSLRFGIHHFSGHYGDEILQDLYSYNKVDFNDNGMIGNYTGDKGESGHQYRLLSQTEYVRDNSWIIGAQAELPWGVRVYGQCEIPQKDAWIRPFIHVPADYINPATGDPNDESSIHRSGRSEGATEEVGLIDRVEAQKRDTGYMALRVHGGIEYTFDLPFATLILSADVQAHQDGQNRNSAGLHEIEAYKSTNPWEFEYTIGGAFALKHKDGSRNVRIEAFYHEGRTPSTQWFYKTGSFISVGLGLN